MSELPWFTDEELAAQQPPVEPIVEQWARALCVAFDASPDKLIGQPKLPRWRSFVHLAERVLAAKLIVEAGR